MNRHVKKFHLIAPLYQLFFKFQRLYYSRLIDNYFPELKSGKYINLLDLGSGTGAFACSWQMTGLKVLAADAAPGMIKQCRRNGLDCIKLDLLEGLPFASDSFHIVTASFLAHGLAPDERKTLYSETSRVAEKLVILLDFSSARNPFITLIERIEKSHYNEFIRSAPQEMAPFFGKVETRAINPWFNLYICYPW